MILVLMGVTGCGKSTIGERLSTTLSWQFEDGDDHHPKSNKDKMSSGVPLNDEDRYQWLLILHQIIKGWHETKQHGIVVCSALKFKYRQVLLFGPSACYHDDNPELLRSSKVEEKTSVSATTSQAGPAGSRVVGDTKNSDTKKSSNNDCSSSNSTALWPDSQTPSKDDGNSTNPTGGQTAITEQDSPSLHQDNSPLTTGSSGTLQPGKRDVKDTIRPSSPELSVCEMQTDSQELNKQKVTPIPECLVNQDVLFVHLAGSFEQISLRLSQRQGHFMNPELLQSQFQTLEALQDGENGMVVDITQGVDSVVSDIVTKIKPVISYHDPSF